MTACINRLLKVCIFLFLLAVFHHTMESSSAYPIFMPYMETADKVNDSMSLSIVSQNAESDEINVARYCVSIV